MCHWNLRFDSGSYLNSCFYVYCLDNNAMLINFEDNKKLYFCVLKMSSQFLQVFLKNMSHFTVLEPIIITISMFLAITNFAFYKLST